MILLLLSLAHTLCKEESLPLLPLYQQAASSNNPSRIPGRWSVSSHYARVKHFLQAAYNNSRPDLLVFLVQYSNSCSFSYFSEIITHRYLVWIIAYPPTHDAFAIAPCSPIYQSAFFPSLYHSVECPNVWSPIFRIKWKIFLHSFSALHGASYATNPSWSTLVKRIRLASIIM